MPTGYTEKLMSKGQTFEEFIMTCARAFGAAITMRDDSLDEPIPEKFEPTHYYPKHLEKAKKMLDKLTAMSDDERIVFGEKEKTKDVKEYMKYVERETAENSRLDEMQKQVEAWVPPTPGHRGLKEFMLEQIDTSRNHIEYFCEERNKALEKSPLQYYKKAVAEAKSDIVYYTKENKKELERVNVRNEWIKQLRNSIRKE